jgi:hypothetical protein
VNEPPLPEIRELLDDLHHETNNYSPPEGGEDGVFGRAETMLRWFLEQYLRRGEHVGGE